MAKSNKRKMNKFIRDAQAGVKDVMISNLSVIAENLINDIMKKATASPESKKPDAIKGLKASGLNAYKKELLHTFTIIAYEAFREAQKEVPKLKTKSTGNIKFVEDEREVRKLYKKMYKDPDRITPPVHKNFDRRMKKLWEELPPQTRKKITIQRDLFITTQVGDLEKAVFFQFGSSLFNTDSMQTVRADLEDAASDFVTGPSINAGSATAGSQIVNQARADFMFSPESESEIEAYQFINNHTTNVTEICTELNGQIFLRSDPNAMKFTPPLHYNCRSYVQPILKGDLRGRKPQRLELSQKAMDNLKFTESENQ